jgi:hypothetical protein
MSATLANIRNKVRLVTKSPGQNTITDAQIDNYVNNFYVYDFPEELRLWQTREIYSFVTEANIDTYAAPQNYLTFHPPLYIAGYECYYSQSRTEFYRRWPIVRIIAQVATGSGIAGPYSAILQNIPIVRNQVLIDAVSNNVSFSLQDDGLGNLVGDGTGTVDYITGALNFTFSGGIAAGVAINAQTVPYVASRPTTMLYFDQTFTVRPIPDQPYEVNIEAYKAPTALLASGDVPELDEWWQYLALGAAMKIFEDRGDFTQIASFAPLFDRYKRLALRRTLVQQTNDRTATIYTEQTMGPFSNFYGIF